MKVHAHAALLLTQRRRMVLRVLEQGWSIKAAAAAAENLFSSFWEVGVSLPRWARARFAGSQLGAAAGRESHR
jgi:hypothetical protein